MLHPSLLPPLGVESLDPILLADIAAGLAQTLPADTPTGRVLVTERYDAWLLELPADHTWHVSPSHRVGAVHSPSGELIEIWGRSDDAAPISRVVPAGHTISLGWGSRQVVNGSSGPIRAVYVSSPPADCAPVATPRQHPLRLVG